VGLGCLVGVVGFVLVGVYVFWFMPSMVGVFDVVVVLCLFL